jgi:hypothetical protein
MMEVVDADGTKAPMKKGPIGRMRAAWVTLAANHTGTIGCGYSRQRQGGKRTATTIQVNGRTMTAIAVDEEKSRQRLEAEGNHAVITIPVAGESNTVIGELNARMVKNMENLQAVVEIKTDRTGCTIPAEQINVDAISAQFGENVEL